MRNIFNFLLLTICCLTIFQISSAAQAKKAKKISAVRLENNGEAQVKILFLTIDGKAKKISDQVYSAWLIAGGKAVVYSSPDGAGGYENEGNSLYIYDAATGKSKKIMSEYYIIETVKEVRLTSGKTALLIEMIDGGLGAGRIAVVDPARGEIFFRNFAKIEKRAGDKINLAFYTAEDWSILAEGDGTARKKVKPSKKESHDLKKIMLGRVIVNKRENL